MFPFTYTKPKYDKLPTDAESEQNDVVLDALPQRFPQVQRFGAISALVVSNIVSALFIITILTRKKNIVENRFEIGYHSDFGTLIEKSRW